MAIVGCVVWTMGGGGGSLGTFEIIQVVDERERRAGVLRQVRQDHRRVHAHGQIAGRGVVVVVILVVVVVVVRWAAAA